MIYWLLHGEWKFINSLRFAYKQNLEMLDSTNAYILPCIHVYASKNVGGHVHILNGFSLFISVIFLGKCHVGNICWECTYGINQTYSERIFWTLITLNPGFSDYSQLWMSGSCTRVKINITPFFDSSLCAWKRFFEGLHAVCKSFLRYLKEFWKSRASFFFCNIFWNLRAVKS